MLRLRIWLAASALAIFSTAGLAATPVHRCDINGTVTFQRDPCPAGGARPGPNLERLNADEKKRREAAAATRRDTAPGPDAAPSAAAVDVDRGKAATANGFRCDGRRYCSQMTSCAEAQYFLAHCPGVKMDGDRNGIPCEQQWCRR